MSQNNCLCGKPKLLSECCGRFLSGSQVAKTPEQLMRSRYCAYALGNHGEYLMATWFPATSQGLNASNLSNNTVHWRRLEVISSSQTGDKGVVEFKAWFSVEGATDELDVMHEVSEFIRFNSRWYYIGGNVS